MQTPHSKALLKQRCSIAICSGRNPRIVGGSRESTTASRAWKTLQAYLYIFFLNGLERCSSWPSRVGVNGKGLRRVQFRLTCYTSPRLLLSLLNAREVHEYPRIATRYPLQLVSIATTFSNSIFPSFRLVQSSQLLLPRQTIQLRQGLH